MLKNANSEAFDPSANGDREIVLPTSGPAGSPARGRDDAVVPCCGGKRTVAILRDLSCGGEVGLVACAVRSTQALKLQVALGMRKQYLDLVPVFARPEILRRASEIACDVACALVEAADNFSHWLARAALFLQRARPTVLLAGAIATLAILVDAATGRLIIAVELARRLAARTCQRVRCRVVCKHRPAECTSSFALLPERDVWRDADHPGQQFRCAIRLSKARC